MERRKFLIGAGSTAIGASALIGSGAFSRVESQRQVDIKVAHDWDAYVGLRRKADADEPGDGENAEEYPNSANFVDYDDKGHLFIKMDETEYGEGVNSNSRSYFNDLFEICNHGKEAAEFCFDTSQLDIVFPENENVNPPNPEDVVLFYQGDPTGSQGMDGITTLSCEPPANVVASEESEDGPFVLEQGECKQIGLLIYTKGTSIPASTTITGEVKIRADVDVDDNNLD